MVVPSGPIALPARQTVLRPAVILRCERPLRRRGTAPKWAACRANRLIMVQSAAAMLKWAFRPRIRQEIMARLRHIAMQVPDPEKAAEFYMRVFGMHKVGETDWENARGVYLSDGVINL